MSTSNPLPLILSGLPGRMAAEVGLAAQSPAWRDRFTLATSGLTGPDSQKKYWFDDACVDLLPPSGRAELQAPADAIAVDFTEPTAALDNVAFYCERGLPFIMGTTGFDSSRASEMVKASGVSAVIAPNMGVPIVLIQWAMAHLAERFPGALAGYDFGVMESHQTGKKDTSGTAKALVRDFARLGLPASEDAIKKIRDPDVQSRELGVPEDHLGGHAYHYYTIGSGDGDVRVELQHLINGRRVYAEGALHAALFLRRRLDEGSKGEVFTMLDVLENMEPAQPA